MVNLNAVETVKKEDAAKTPVTFQAPVLGYELFVRATPANTPNDPHDDITLTYQCHSNALPYVYCDNRKTPGKQLVVDAKKTAQTGQVQDPGVELVVTDEHNKLLSQLNKDGEWNMYTEGSIMIQTSIVPQTVALRSLHTGPSYDTIEIVGSKGTLIDYNDARVSAWMNSGLEFTEGGNSHPRWNHTFVPDKQMVQYKAGPHWGRKWTILGTPEFDQETGTMADPCIATIPCTPGVFEKHYLVGVDTETKRNRLVVQAPADATTVQELHPGEIVASRYDGEKLNLGTYLVDAPLATARNGTMSLDQKTIQIAGAAPLKLPKIEGVTGVESALYGYASLGDKDHNGKITEDELACTPIARKFTPLQFVPEGEEAKYFALGFISGLAVGLPVGYVIPHPPVPIGPGPEPVPTIGSGGFGQSGNVVQ